MSQSQALFLCVCFRCSSKGHASWLWLVVFDLYFFVAEKPLPMTWTCTIVNFHNVHSLLGQIGSLVFEQMESSDWCWFVVKKKAFSERYKAKIEDFSWKKGPACCFISSHDWSLLWFVCYLLRFHLASDWSRNKHSRNFLLCLVLWEDCKMTILLAYFVIRENKI